jgi:hypothetical protein
MAYAKIQPTYPFISSGGRGGFSGLRGASRRSSLQDIDQEFRKALNFKVISGLDGLRALAVSLVIIDPFSGHRSPNRRPPRARILWCHDFFVLSGFLITSMLLKEHSRTGGISLANFYRS